MCVRWGGINNNILIYNTVCIYIKIQFYLTHKLIYTFQQIVSFYWGTSCFMETSGDNRHENRTCTQWLYSGDRQWVGKGAEPVFMDLCLDYMCQPGLHYMCQPRCHDPP